ncbi:hypothetical protein [Microbacterium sediminis]|uniref:Uncharacterized protein n=1 Tax=Microbacterium sediminis TaxID=904291 RepID=A0A1B9N9I2_9MICO|nr:hypothetical protein [Microbacterium sediminis]OCG73262.1 hypothetical protein A7J15_08130 [Microbacterium sediminis]QBR75151.1 hypothetical protein E3O41_12590 [Microbacterium sediminis]
MSSDALPKTVVPSGIRDEVELARAELKAALAAIEHKANLPARAAEATERKVAEAKSFARRKPAVAAAAAVAVAVAVGAAVWGVAALLSKRH